MTTGTSTRPAIRVQDESSNEQIIGGRYRLYGPIASGGMATVHFGRQLGAGGFARTIAIKRLRGEFLDSHEFIATLLDEARLASRIRHPNVVATLDMVATEDEVFLVMEYVVGESLSRMLTTMQGTSIRVDPRVAAGVLVGVLHALHAAHEATDERGEPLDIVHRDVSPQNVLVGVDGLARLLDFGIAKGKGRLQTTRAGQLKGKVGYMAPEQILGEDPDRRSDVYSAAVVLWEVLTGRRLFPSSDSAGANFNLIPKILEADIDPPSSVVPTLPKVLDGIVMRGLNRQREARYSSAREFAIALEEGVGLATARKIGEWVDEVASDALAERAALLLQLEASAPNGDRRLVAQLADVAVKRQRRKRLRRTREAGDRERRSRADTVAEQPAVTASDIDAPTEVDDGMLDDPSEVTTVTSRSNELMRTSAWERDKDASAPEQAQEPDPEQLRKTSHWSKDDETEEVVTAVHEPSKILKGPPELPPEEEDDKEKEDITKPDVTLRPSDHRPGTPPPSAPPIPSSAPVSLGSDDVELPVRSNRAVVIAVVVVAAIAAAAAGYKMTSHGGEASDGATSTPSSTGSAN